MHLALGDGMKWTWHSLVVAATGIAACTPAELGEVADLHHGSTNEDAGVSSPSTDAGPNPVTPRPTPPPTSREGADDSTSASEPVRLPETLTALGTDSISEPCRHGTWDHDHDPSTACVPWRSCARDEIETVSPTLERDRECEPCASGTYRLGDADTCLDVQPGSYRQVSAGPFHVCALRADDYVDCWGDNDNGEATPPAGVAFTQVAAGEQHTCGLRADDGRLQCWGREAERQSSPRGDARFVQISAGHSFTCGVRAEDSHVRCWGRPGDLPTELEGDFVEVSAGRGVCGLQRDGHVVCAGSVPDEPIAFADVSVPWQSNGRYRDERPACAVTRDDSTVVCWGGSLEVMPSDWEHRYIALDMSDPDKSGAIFGGHRGGSVLPPEEIPFTVPFPGSVAFSAVEVGAHHACGIRRDDGNVQCWGGNVALTDNWWFEGDLVLLTAQAEPPTGVAFSSLSLGEDYSCGVRKDDGAVQCWGRDRAGTARAPSRVAVSGLSVTGRFSCGLRSVDGVAQCWGEDEFLRATPPAEALSSVVTGVHHACGLRAATGEALCWGSNWRARPEEINTEILSLSPSGQSEPPADVRFAGLAAGLAHTCGIRQSDGRVECWGANGYLGRSDELIVVGQSSPPADVAFSRLSAGFNHTCGIRTEDGNVQCWGRDDLGQVEAPLDAAFSLLDSEEECTCGVRAEDGHVQCWGTCADAQLSAARYSSIGVGRRNVCGIRADDSTVECSGSNDYGQSDPPSGVTFRELSGGTDFICGARAADGVEVCWGAIARSL